MRLERADGGGYRWRGEPKVAFGLVPNTEVELRAPALRLERPEEGGHVTSLAGLGLGVMHALSAETPRVPALALAAEVMLPVGGFRAPDPLLSAKLMATRSTRFGRVHLNAAVGGYSVVGPPRCPRLLPPGDTCDDNPRPNVPDVPCDREPGARAPRNALPDGPPLAETACGAQSTTTAPTASVQLAPRVAKGARWTAALGLDHAWGVRSLLVGADVVAERFVGLSPVEWTAEAGVRRQLGPRTVFDAGGGRRMTGAAPGAFATAGVTFTWSAARHGRG
jgi:hypothetical protein